MAPDTKVLLWDTETTALRGDSGNILVISYKWLGEKEVHTLRIDTQADYDKNPAARLNDIQILKDFEDIYNQASVTVAHYGAEFDVKEMNARRAIQGLKPLPRTKCYDTWYAAKMTFNFKSNSVKNLAEVFGFKEQKMPVKWEVWRLAMAGDRRSIETLVKRCESDVRVLELIYNKLVVWAPQYLPNIHLVTKGLEGSFCRVCGQAGLIRRGLALSHKAVNQRYQCKKCGAWSQGKRML